MSGVWFSSRSASRHDRDRDGITGGSRAVSLRDPFLGYGRGGSDPAGPPAPRGAGSRPREIEGVAPPSPATPPLTPAGAHLRHAIEHLGLLQRHDFQELAGGAFGAFLASEARTMGASRGANRGATR